MGKLQAGAQTKQPHACTEQRAGRTRTVMGYRLSGLALVLLLLSIGLALCFDARPPSSDVFPDLYEASVEDLQKGMEAGHFTSVDLVKAYFTRIEEVNAQEAALHAVIELNPSAITQAAALDLERKSHGIRGPLHGIPDNIATITSEGMNTTAGSFSLLGCVVSGDAGVVKRLRAAGAIILGKANMSEWAYFRGQIPSGWSARGGQCTNAYFKNASPCGSSSGSGVAASIGLSTVTLGTETDGSITCPVSHNNVVGIKPTVGLTSRAGVIPISTHQDTVGPMTRSIADAAIVLSVIAGKDPNDNRTLAQPDPVPDYPKALNKDSLRGKRIGVPRLVLMNDSYTGNDPSVNRQFEKAVEVLRSLGAITIDPANIPSAEEILASNNEEIVLSVDFKVELNSWLSSLPQNPSGVRSLANVIKFNDDNAALEKPPHYEDQSRLINSEATHGPDKKYWEALAANHDVGATRGIDFVLREYKLDALVLPARKLASTHAALAGYPIVTVPLGFYPDDVTVGYTDKDHNIVYPAPGVPFGLSFLGPAFSELDLIGFGYAYEQATHTRLARRAFAAAIPKTQLYDIVSGEWGYFHGSLKALYHVLSGRIFGWVGS
ncbi:hypothetical protein NP233_g1546 [Leucocoprinus birnbaumii]|uniref:Ig-like domain-containing protein n=1 Tax=Leucocoprinus birnbaumii TaxID=56174 RepID=A0AAD5W049_9AGAR|nr:hypothetical protein NP233_g1546 [Leucocoprinus birnbaumii]